MNVSIFDPTGNLTALVETPVAAARQPAVAGEILRARPAVEQVGFVTEDESGLSLRMAGGEFCGNAAMSAAALSLLRRGERSEAEQPVTLRVSGADDPVEVRLRKEGDGFHAGVRMPPAREIREVECSLDGERGTLPVVWMQGISHVLIAPGSVFWPLRAESSRAEAAAVAWCRLLGAEGLGLMFLDEAAGRLTPLVYVPGSGTTYWENACASGTSAVGMAIAAREGRRIDRVFSEPGGCLRVVSEPGGATWLYGHTRRIEQFELS